ncbi:radical SAM protein [Actinomadura sp. KC345]|uniref:radical SAM protein n=1 Tax=Actinomadura sp. KC345 TaxID=2530371 RepID=UPI00140500A0|nr:radical SAM protein [Actinomadura sp. KC345]
MPRIEHDFVAKLRQPHIADHVDDVVAALANDDAGFPGGAPISINLDLTTACNYRCDHCIDYEILNSGPGYDQGVVLSSLVSMTLAGLRSVILIGGGEPTVHPHFANVVEAIKMLGLQCAIVSNGGRPEKLRRVATLLTGGDWVRLSLDAGTDETFQAMHQPVRPVRLEEICESVREAKKDNPAARWGFSFIVSWSGLSGPNERPLETNVHEIAAAAALAKDSGFDYISFKPMLQRDAEGAETIAWPPGVDGERLRAELTHQLEKAGALRASTFQVLESLNLDAAAKGADSHLRDQPSRCAMHFFRQVLTPTGVYGCAAYRGDPKDRLGEADAYAGVRPTLATGARTHAHVEAFDAAHECRNITCIYNSANRWVDSLRETGEATAAGAQIGDYYL